MWGMRNWGKPLVVIVLAVAVAAGAAVFLSREPAQVTQTSVAGSIASKLDGGERRHSRGPESAKVTLVEFGDYQCPTCGFYHPVVLELLKRYPQDLRLEFRHFPLIAIHQNAMAASVAAEAAGEQGRFWEMHDLLFAHQDRWAQNPNPEAEFLSYANQLGLDANAFMKATRSPETQQRVLKDVVEARDGRLDRVPTFFLQGKQIPIPKNFEEFTSLIDSELRAK